jgi:transglutaminase-like putative cysteine protease
MRLQGQSNCSRFLSAPVFSRPIPDGDAGVEQTIRWMKGLVNGPQGAKSWRVRQAALEAARGTERGMQEMAAVLDWVKRNIEFRGELGEYLQSPEATLTAGAGDCDCQSMLEMAMLKNLGFETRFNTISLQDDPGELSHVYVEVRDKLNGQWVPLDPTVSRSYAGWQPEEMARSVAYAPTVPSPSPLMDGLIATGATLGALLLFS